MKEQQLQTEFITSLVQEVGILKSDCIYKDVIIQGLKREIETLNHALAEVSSQLEALKEVETYTMNEECEMDDVVDSSFVCD